MTGSLNAHGYTLRIVHWQASPTRLKRSPVHWNRQGTDFVSHSSPVLEELKALTCSDCPQEKNPVEIKSYNNPQTATHIVFSNFDMSRY